MKKVATVVAVCVSIEKGTTKTPVAKGRLIEDCGIEGDAHAGAGNRQVSLLCESSIDKMRGRGVELTPGVFAENLTIRGVESGDLPLGAKLMLERGPVLEISQIGKACHHGCAIRQIVGDCVMPREGVFARVLTGGEVRAGDTIEVIADED